jgi:imidazoleglycerol phosphate dehydratase HisB
MALGRAVRDHLLSRSVDNSVIDSILKRANGIVEVSRLHLIAADSAISLGRVMAELVGPRNDAARNGLAPSAQVAKNAIETAGQMLHEASPI